MRSKWRYLLITNEKIYDIKLKTIPDNLGSS